MKHIVENIIEICIALTLMLFGLSTLVLITSIAVSEVPAGVCK